jgi:hypothetical protein
MPGKIIDAHCPCGFSGGGSPGFELGEDGSLVMAYAESSPDQEVSVGTRRNYSGEPLFTLPETEAQRRGLTILPDPSLEREPRDRGPWHHYRCPLCAKNTMTLELVGFWD